MSQDGYLPLNQIDFRKTQEFFQNLPFFEDVIFNMQAMNITITDQFITNYEYALLQEYFEIEKTPVETAMLVSALSQMWIFSLYELLRTWRQRSRTLLEAKKNGKIDELIILEKENDFPNLSRNALSESAKKVKQDESFVVKIEDSMNAVDRVWRLIHSLRINLAKHEIPGQKNQFHHFPGYGRINGSCGALDFELSKKESYSIINRRDIADLLKQLADDMKK